MVFQIASAIEYHYAKPILIALTKFSFVALPIIFYSRKLFQLLNQ